MQDALDDQSLLPAVAIFGDLLPGKGAAHLAPREGDHVVDRGVVAGIGAQGLEARDAVFPQRHGPARRHHHLSEHRSIGMKSAAAETDHHFAGARGAHRHVEREDQRIAVGRRSAAHQIEADGVIVLRGAVKLKPADVGRDFRDLFDGSAAGEPERIGNARLLRGAGEMPVGAGPDDRRAAHRRYPDRRGIAAAEQFDLAGRQRRHHAVARHHFHGIERRPIAPNAGIVLAGAAVGIFESEMRQPAARGAAQIVDGRIMPIKRGIARIGALADVMAGLRRGGFGRLEGRRVMHERFSHSTIRKSGRRFSEKIVLPVQAIIANREAANSD